MQAGDIEARDGDGMTQVRKVQTRGREVIVRRALRDDELGRLLDVATPLNRALYLVAVCIGLRRGELEALVWGDVVVAGGNHYIRARASTTKNHNEAVLGLHPDAVAALKGIRPPEADEGTPVFSRLPSCDEFRADLKKAGTGMITRHP